MKKHDKKNSDKWCRIIETNLFSRIMVLESIVTIFMENKVPICQNSIYFLPISKSDVIVYDFYQISNNLL